MNSGLLYHGREEKILSIRSETCLIDKRSGIVVTSSDLTKLLENKH